MSAAEAASDQPPQPTPARVAPARRLITKPKDLITEVEGRHIGMLPLRFGSHVFQEGEDPTSVAEVAVVDVEAQPPRPIAVLEISWKRVVPALRLGEPGVWQIGRLVREEEYQAVELLPPEPGFNLERAAVQLAQLETPKGAVAGQLALPMSDPPATPEEEEIDDDVPF